MKVIRNYLYNVGYNLLAILLPLITTPYVTRVLTSKGYGINSYTSANIQYFVLLGSLGIALYGNREIAYAAGRRDREGLTKSFWEIQIIKTVAIILSYLAFLIFMMFDIRYSNFMWIQSLNIVAAAFDISWLYMGVENFKLTVIRNTLIKLLSLVLIFTFVKTPHDVGTYILILAGSTFGANLTLWPYLRHVLVKVPLHSLHPLRHLMPIIILFVPQIATQIYLQLNKTVLGLMISPTSSGYYYSSDQLVKIILTVVTSMGTVMLPHASKAFSKGHKELVNKYLYESFDFVTFLSVAMAFGLAGIGLHMGPWFFGQGYKPVGEAIMIESIVIVLIAWSNAVGQQYLLPTNKVHAYTASVVWGAVINIIVDIPFVHLWGLNGAMWATVLSEFVVTAYQVWYVRKMVSLKKLFMSLPKYLLAGLIMFFPVFKMNITQRTTVWSIMSEVLVGIVVYLVLIFILKPTIVSRLKKFIEKRRARG